MSNIIRIGRPRGISRSTRLMTDEECRARDHDEVERQKAASRAASKWQLQRVIEHMMAVSGAETTKADLMAVARLVFKD